MDWLIFALLAPLVYTVVNFTDKFVVGKAIPDADSVPVFLAIVHGTMALLFWIILGFPILSPDVALSIMLTGALVVVGTFLLFRALLVEETSKIVMWTQMQHVIVLLLALLILDEQLTLIHTIGFAIIFIATLGLSFDRKSLQITPAFIHIMLAVLVWSVSDILLKYTLNQHPDLSGDPSVVFDAPAFLIIIIYQSAGFALAGLLIYLFFPKIRRNFNTRIRIAPRYALAILFANESIFILRQFIRTLAIALGPVALVSVLDGTRIFLGIVVGWVLTLIAPAIFAENISREGLRQKFIFSFILFVGILVLSLSQGRG